ncbi:hypothetical protein BGZ65_010158 [Modicella reniformis]|uniref:Transmembrane 9 superfamily member n=1 Tax=Modicella reniformis TaxID=1440133 RepID=A0A9P6MKI0_9FUNG|nr:hypothetical protein BGZ65_010158 [Modicella reniformis]
MVSLRAGATATLITALLALSTLPSIGLAFYIPGLSPTVFREGDRVPLYVNKIFSEKSPLPYAYADLPFVCAPPKDAKKAWLNLGEVLRGDRISTSEYELIVGHDIECSILCSKRVSAEDAALARDFIANDYDVEWIVDNLPGATRYNLGDGQATKQWRYRAGFPLGKVKWSKSNIHNHVTIRILYQSQGPNGGKLIVGFEVSPYSIDQGDVETCPKDPLKVGAFQAVSDKEVDIQYTYSVQWIEDKEITWSNRWNLYLVSTDVQIHWYSIVNSIVIMVFLAGLVALIIMRTLKKDIAIYNEEEMKDEQDEGAGWKLVHGDVFRTPKYSSLLCAILGSGVQILVMAVSTISEFAWLCIYATEETNGLPQILIIQLIFFTVFALFGILNPSYRGGFVSFGLFLFVFAGIMLGGLLPFAVIFIELFYILKSIWEDQYYYMFGFLSLVFVILLVTCVEVSIVVTYFQLCDEDYNWWWRSFMVPSFSAVYIFLYSMVYFTKQLSIDHFVPGLIYFTNSLMICIVYGLLTGTTGFISTYWFIRRIYSAVKID